MFLRSISEVNSIWSNIMKMRFLISIFLFCLFHNCEIINAKSLVKPEAVSRVNSVPSSNDTCLTPACKKAASQVLKDMDRSVAPCDDFYKFACGNFLKTTVIPEDQIYVDKFSLARDSLEKKLKSSIEEAVNPNEPKAFRLAKNFYKACMNTAAIEKQGLRTVLGELKTIGGWPLLEGKSWKDTSFDWIKSVEKLRKLGYSADYFFSFGVGVNLKDNTKRALAIGQTPLGLVRPYLIKGFGNPVVNAYYRYLVDIARFFGADKATAEKELKETLEFEIKLANISIPATQIRTLIPAVNQMTVKKLSLIYPSIPWKNFFNAILSPILQINDTEVIVVNVPIFFKEFETLMKATPQKILANYFIQRAVDENVNYLTDEIRNRKIKFMNEISATVTKAPRWAECFDMTIENLGLSVNALFVRKYFNKASKKSAIELITNIVKQFKKILKEVDWMDEKTRKIALEKVENLRSQTGYPDEFLDDKALDEFYNGLEISPVNYLQAVANVSLFLQEYSFRELRKPVNNTDWTSQSDTAVIRAAYIIEENRIDIPSGILQEIFFSQDRPQSLNYAMIGTIIGHEITYGFGEDGSHFDKEGNLMDWWSPETKTKYDKKANCIIKQYGSYTVKELGLQVNGYNTKIENIAYNGGIKEAYLAYKDWVKQKGPEFKLPGVSYSPGQLFWIGAAQTWCTKYRPEELKFLMTSDMQSPAEFRIQGAFSNRPEFAADFNCPVGSKMNPVNKCTVW